MHKKFEIIRKKIKGGCQSGREVVTHNSKTDLPLSRIKTKMVHITNIDSKAEQFVLIKKPKIDTWLWVPTAMAVHNSFDVCTFFQMLARINYSTF